MEKFNNMEKVSVFTFLSIDSTLLLLDSNIKRRERCLHRWREGGR